MAGPPRRRAAAAAAAAAALAARWPLACAAANETVEHLSEPAEVTAALRRAIAADRCSTQYVVSDDLFCTAESYNRSAQTGLVNLGGAASSAMVWLSGPGTLSKLLNDEALGCCAPAVTTMGQCLCRVLNNAGIIDEAENVSYMRPVPPYRYVLVTMFVNHTNRTSSNLGDVHAITPTWANLLGAMGETFAHTLDTAEESVPACVPTEEVQRELMNTTYADLYAKYRPKFEAFNITVDDCMVDSPARFLAHKQELCTNAAVTRLYLCTFLSAQTLFTGDGVTSGGTREFITIPNHPVTAVVSGLARASVLTFDMSEGETFTCPMEMDVGRSAGQACWSKPKAVLLGLGALLSLLL